MTHAMESLAWTLIHFCWQAAAIAFVYRVLDSVLSRGKSRARYVLALSALLAMFATAVITLSYEQRRGATLLPQASALDLTASALPDQNSAIPNHAAPSPAFQMAALLPALLPMIDVLWMLGVLALTLRTIGGWWMIERLRRTACIEAPEAVRASFRSVCRTLGFTRPVTLRLSKDIAGPLTIGVFRTLILLPLSAVTMLSADELEVVFAHELAHVRRADYLWNLLQTMIETLFFFHPAVWWVSRCLREQRELCCDDIALGVCASPLVYASALFRLEERRTQQQHLAMAFDGHQSPMGLRARIARILGEPPARKHKPTLQPFSLAAVFGGLALFLIPLPSLVAGLETKPHVAAVATTPAPELPAIASRLQAAPAHLSALAETASSVRMPVPEIAATQETQNQETQGTESSEAGKQDEGSKKTDPTGKRPDYIDQMRAAGYDVDLEKYFALKVQGVTPEFARAAAQMGLGKPSADDLIAMKVHNITPEFVAQLRQSGTPPKDFDQAVAFRIFKVDGEFVAAMKAAGFGPLDGEKLIALRVQHATPEFARDVKKQFPDATADDLVSMRIFHIDQDFMAEAKKHGFEKLSIDKLVQLRISGLLDSNDSK